MLPLFDENPTGTRPWVTVTLMVLSVGLFLFAGLRPAPEPVGFATTDLDQDLPEQLAFALEWGAIPCEVVQGRPLTAEEIAETYYRSGDIDACKPDSEAGPVFADKNVLAAMVFSMFLHDGVFHLCLNMLFLWIFGNNVEDRLGHLVFLLFYLASGLLATALYISLHPSATVAILGASGAVAGVMGNYLLWYPDAPIRTVVFLVLVDIRARWFLGAWFALQFFTWSGPRAWIAHVAGFLFGMGFGWLVRHVQPRLRLPRRPKTAQSPSATVDGWDETGGAGHGPYPHLDEVWSHPERYDREQRYQRWSRYPNDRLA